MPNSIFSLPPELLSRIFEYLAEDRRDISSSRLVNNAFKAASSPFLITEVVFAKRLPEIAKLHEVACHPYFSRYVTHLVYDLSWWKFNELEMNDPTEMMDYIAACEEAEDFEIRHFLDEEWAHRVQEESEFYRSLSQNRGEPSAEQAKTFLYNQKTAASADVISQNAALNDLNEAGGEAFRMGCYQSFPQYKRNAHFHERIAAKGEYLNILKPILAKLPKLRAVTFTDYRGLAKKGETYRSLCSRMFGNMLEPERWNWELDQGALCTPEAITALKAIAEVKGGLQSVSFGPHFYEMVSFPEEPLINYKEPHYLSIEDMGIEEDQSEQDLWTKFFEGLRSIRLPFLFTEATFEAAPAETLLKALPDTIEHLALSAKGPVEAFSLLEQASPQLLRPFSIISPLRFPRLKSLELEGWCMPISNFREMLLAHASTLRSLHLVNLVLISGGEDERDQDLNTLATAVAAKSHLTGVEVTKVRLTELHDIPSIDAEEDPWLIPFQNEQDDWDGQSVIAATKPWDSKLEALFLGGRPNGIRRRRPALAKGHKGDDLGCVPAYW
ncbi:hypothetical protein Q7P36_001041 [Cladosporium allicinum]